MDSKGTHQQQNRNAAAALAVPTSTAQAMHRRLSDGDLSLRQPQPQQALMLDGSTQQPGMQLGIEQRGRGRGQGRPRKYAPPPDVIDGDNANSSGPPAKRGRGRPPVSGNKQRSNALGGEEGSFTPHIINVYAGEDIATKLMAFVNQEPRHVCILSASGAVSSAVIQSNNPPRCVKYEGLYDIIHMSGAFFNTESNGTMIRTGKFAVSLAGLHGKVVGGCVGRTLVAGSPVQVIVGSFVPEGVKPSAASSAPANVSSLSGGGGGGGGPGLPQSQASSSESSEENDNNPQ